MIHTGRRGVGVPRREPRPRHPSADPVGQRGGIRGDGSGGRRAVSANALVRGSTTSAFLDVLEPSPGVSQFLPAQPSKRHARTVSSQCGNDFLHLLPVHVLTFPCQPAQLISPKLGMTVCQCHTCYGWTSTQGKEPRCGSMQDWTKAEPPSSASCNRQCASAPARPSNARWTCCTSEGTGAGTRALLSSDFVGLCSRPGGPVEQLQAASGARV